MRRIGHPLTVLAAAIAAAGLFGPGASAPAESISTPPKNGPTPLATGDFNADGFDDLAIGVPLEDVLGKLDAGAVHVLYGSANGLSAAGDQFWHQGLPGMPGKLEKGDRFGWALAAGDFDKDGRDDLAIGAPFENITHSECSPIFGCQSDQTYDDAGYVVVLYGTASGLSNARAKGFSRESDGLKGASFFDQYFGFALAAADFDGDGFDDLAVGAPGDRGDRGGVHVLFGRSGGLSAKRDQLWRQGENGVDGIAEDDDYFGASLAAGNLGYSTRERDLVIGAPGETTKKRFGTGAVHVLYGQPGAGLTAKTVPDRFLDLAVAGVEGEQVMAGFGWALAVADFGRSTQSDLAVGAPGYRGGSGEGTTGAVSVFYADSYGVNPEANELWTPTTAGVGQAALFFGLSLAAGDFDSGGGSKADLAIGAPTARFGDVKGAGAVRILYGTPLGLRISGSIALAPQTLTRMLLAGASPRKDDAFAFALAAGSFGGGVGADLAISAPGVDRGDDAATVDTGEVYVAYGSATGLAQSSTATWAVNQDTPDVEDQAEAADRLGGG